MAFWQAVQGQLSVPLSWVEARAGGSTLETSDLAVKMVAMHFLHPVKHAGGFPSLWGCACGVLLVGVGVGGAGAAHPSGRSGRGSRALPCFFTFSLHDSAPRGRVVRPLPGAALHTHGDQGPVLLPSMRWCGGVFGVASAKKNIEHLLLQLQSPTQSSLLKHM